MILQFAINLMVLMSRSSHPRCHVEHCWDSTDLQHRYEQIHFPKFVSKKSLQYSTSRCSLLGQQQELTRLHHSNKDTPDPSNLLFCIVSIMVSEKANFAPLHKLTVAVLACHVFLGGSSITRCFGWILYQPVFCFDINSVTLHHVRS